MLTAIRDDARPEDADPDAPSPAEQATRYVLAPSAWRTRGSKGALARRSSPRAAAFAFSARWPFTPR